MVGRRLAGVAAAILLALGGAAVVASPAQAAPPGCSLGIGHYEQAGGYVTGYKYWFCQNGDDIPLSVSVLRYMSPGVYQTVASGTGEATYYCGGLAYNVFRTSGTGDFAVLCT